MKKTIKNHLTKAGWIIAITILLSLVGLAMLIAAVMLFTEQLPLKPFQKLKENVNHVELVIVYYSLKLIFTAILLILTIALVIEICKEEKKFQVTKIK